MALALVFVGRGDYEKGHRACRACQWHSEKALAARQVGWIVENGNAVAPAVVPGGIPVMSFGPARVKWALGIRNPEARVDKLTRLFAGKQEVASIPSRLQALQCDDRRILSLAPAALSGAPQGIYAPYRHA
jgi:hypothetical protein